MSESKGSKKRSDEAIAAQREYMAKREKGYREQALKLYPWVCGRCAREFSRANLSELTVHHVNHNHDDNPSDGSNWELLCLYCHDEEHTKFENFIRYGGESESEHKAATYNPFAGLKEALEKNK
ncbi:MAG: YajD family HNH nuclease [Pseudohongiellaceae bacterium]|nr:YajD family HNH nuclease [Pseudohongiellaceae bacterium]